MTVWYTHLWIVVCCYVQVCTNPSRQVARATGFLTVAPNAFSVIIAVYPVAYRNVYRCTVHRAESHR